MLKEYTNEYVTERDYSRSSGSYKLIERYDLHFQDNVSDKVYICTLQEYTSGVGKKLYAAIARYGRRGSSLTTTRISGEVETLAEAHKLMDKQMKSKEKKGYNLVGHWIDESLKAQAIGALRPEVLDLIKQRYPEGARIESPSTGKSGVIVPYDNLSTMVQVEIDGQIVGVPFDKIGYFKVIG